MADDSGKRRRNPPLIALRAFEASGRSLSFTRAAENLGVTQSAVSRHIKHLEDVLGQPLFRRGIRALELTDAGTALLPGVTQAFDIIDATLEQVEKTSANRLVTISMPPTFAMRFGLNAICGFHRAVPQAEVRVHINIDQADLKNKNIDIAIEHMSAGDGGHRILLEPERLVAVCHPRFLERIRGHCLAEAIEVMPLLHVAQREGPYVDWQLWVEGAELGPIDHSRGLVFEMGEMVINAALNGSGIALAERMFVEKYLATGALIAPFDYVHTTGRGHFISADFGTGSQEKVRQLHAWFVQGHWRNEFAA